LDWCIANARTEQALRLAAALWRFWQMRGHLREGRARVEAVLRLPGGDKFPEARRHALEAAGGIAYWQADMAAAQVWYDEAFVLFRGLDDQFGLGWALHTRALAAINVDDAATAEPLIAEAFDLFGKAGDISALTILLDDAAQVARLHGDRLRSLRLAAAAAAVQAKTGAEIAMMANAIGGRP